MKDELAGRFRDQLDSIADDVRHAMPGGGSLILSAPGPASPGHLTWDLVVQLTRKDGELEDGYSLTLTPDDDADPVTPLDGYVELLTNWVGSVGVRSTDPGQDTASWAI